MCFVSLGQAEVVPWCLWLSDFALNGPPFVCACLSLTRCTSSTSLTRTPLPMSSTEDTASSLTYRYVILANKLNTPTATKPLNCVLSLVWVCLLHIKLWGQFDLLVTSFCSAAGRRYAQWKVSFKTSGACLEKGKWGKSSQQMQEENMTSVSMQNTAWGKVMPQDLFEESCSLQWNFCII